MAYSEAGKRAVAKYQAKVYDTFLTRVKKGEKARFQAYAQARGMSLNAYINYLIKKDMEENPMPVDVKKASIQEES